MSSTTLTIDQLRLSPHNVRTNEEDANATAAMERSLLERGQMMPLLVHPMRGKKGQWGVFAGGRRYRSFNRLIEDAKLPADHPIEVIVRDVSDAELIELSLAENMVRRDLRPYEVFAAVVKAHKRGASIADIAETVGQPEIWIQRSIRLGTLAKPVFEALERGKISVEQASAFAATEDQELQLDAWKALCGSGDTLGPVTPAQIRTAIGIGDIEAQKLLRFVGAGAYLAAGGSIELDLFSDGSEERGRIRDVPLLRKLAEEKFASVREDARERTRRPELRFVPKAPPQPGYTFPDTALRVTPKVIDEKSIELPDGDIVGLIELTDDGAQVSYWWASRKAKFGTPKPLKTVTPNPSPISGAAISGSIAPGVRPLADAAIKDDTGATQDAIQILRTVRRTIMRGAFLENAAAGDAVALDYLIFAQLRIELKREYAHQLGLRPLGQGDHGPVASAEVARDHIAATEASRRWVQAMHELLQQRFMTADDQVEAYHEYRAAGPAIKRTAQAFVAGLALERSLNADGYRLPMHDALAEDLDLISDDRMRTFWRPTAAMLDLLPKSDRLKIAEPFVEAASFGPWSRLKASEITSLVLAAVTGTSNVVRASCAAAAASWVHPLLRFAGTGPAVATELQEAAE
jgi:ParB family chromosome partitioning protein